MPSPVPGFPTVIVDTNPESLKQAYNSIEKNLGDGVPSGQRYQKIAPVFPAERFGL